MRRRKVLLWRCFVIFAICKKEEREREERTERECELRKRVDKLGKR